MKITILAFILILTTACGKKEIKKVEIDPAFQAHVDEFQQNASLAGRPVKIDNLVVKAVANLNDLNTNGNTLGVCYTSYRETTDWMGNKKVYATPVIHIDQTDWNNLSSSGRKQLIFHELGHCVIDRPHSNSTNSIMYPYHNVVQNSFITRYNSMIYELYNPDRTVAAVGFQAINLASTMDEPEPNPETEESNSESLDAFAATNMYENEVGHIVHNEDCHKIIRIEDDSQAE